MGHAQAATRAGTLNPFRYRDLKPDEDWADNWLSNALAWSSRTFMPAWCSDAAPHWTGKLADYLFTSCPCCMMFRGVALGVFMTWLVYSVLIVLFAAVYAWMH